VAIVGWEWIVILAILAVIMIWGPDKIPKLARALGQARKEFERAQKEFTNPTPEPEPASITSDDYLIQTAKSLGIETAGKTREQISKEIVERARATQPQTTQSETGQQQ